MQTNKSCGLPILKIADCSFSIYWMIMVMSVLPFHNVSASSWCSLGWPNFPEPPDDHLIALETNATRSGEFGSIRLKSLAKCSRTNTKNVITQLQGYHVIAADYRYCRLCKVGKCWIFIILYYFIDVTKLTNIVNMHILMCFSFCHWNFPLTFINSVLQLFLVSWHD